MRWIKKGLIFEPSGQYDWVVSHAMLPIAEKLSGNLFRIYFSGRDKLNRSQTGYLEVDITNPTEILYLSEKPVISLGELGCFDSNGVSPTCIVNKGDKKYLYYLGWNPEGVVKVGEVSGLAISNDDGKTFVRHSRAPILPRTNEEPFSILVISCVMIEAGIWRMWYDSANRWLAPDLPSYNIKYAESLDGIHWTKRGLVSVDYAYPEESRISRPCVIKEDGIYKMWYCYAIGRNGYQLGYAESTNGVYFIRKDSELEIAKSASGWDSHMMCYPHVFSHRGTTYMLYCGNDYGKTGFGYAILE